MDKLGELIESITKPRYEEDYIDRWNYRITSYVLLLAAFAVIAKDYGGDPIQCWLPAELATQRGWEQYARDYCFVESTYFIPMETPLTYSSRYQNGKKLTYYQWVPFVLMLQALMFTLPHIFWRMFNWISGIHIRAVITMASDATNLAYGSKELNDTVAAITKHLHRSLGAKSLVQRFTYSNFCISATRFLKTSYLTTLYLTTKLLFIGNGFLQFFLLSSYLGSNGFQQTKAVLNSDSWKDTGFFPRVTLCDFKVRGMGNQHRHTIQCVLMANMFNEKIFIALWWWILILLTFTCINFTYWIYVLFSTTSKLQLIRGLVQLGQPGKKRDECNLSYMDYMDYLGRDGILVFRLMTQNAGDMVTSITAAQLYDTYCTSQNRRRLDGTNFNKTFKELPIPSLISEKLSDTLVQKLYC